VPWQLRGWGRGSCYTMDMSWTLVALQCESSGHAMLYAQWLSQWEMSCYVYLGTIQNFRLFFSFFLMGWGLNSGLCACKAGTVPLEPHLQFRLFLKGREGGDDAASPGSLYRVVERSRCKKPAEVCVATLAPQLPKHPRFGGAAWSSLSSGNAG
jgi:hypothetical protein